MTQIESTCFVMGKYLLYQNNAKPKPKGWATWVTQTYKEKVLGMITLLDN